jgi:CRP/FNR family transcriptional regulator, cyclic AMP receptor protein
MDLDLLRQMNLFRNLDGVQLAHLWSIMTDVALPRGKVLFKEGDKAEHLYFILKGKIRISKIIMNAGEEAFAILPTGTYFGEMELIQPELTRAAQATAHETCSLKAMAYKDFHEMMQSDHELAQAFLWSMVQTLADRLRETNDKVAAMFALAQF